MNVDERGREDLLVRELANKKKWKRCPRCRFYVEKNDGCLHISRAGQFVLFTNSTLFYFRKQIEQKIDFFFFTLCLFLVLLSFLVSL
ncbi:putative E3 ubiquitin ligase RBR family [Medicago truncatula]|uniref:Putative E3 ubiquitin ligase RBR family n=1 Tax=Medicago truncatula TaxID=3880 RepID=A0A396JXT0_MEDTR|nr:putative E3 ubiquitin ligase RBR family [Medicago truncatula]